MDESKLLSSQIKKIVEYVTNHKISTKICIFLIGGNVYSALEEQHKKVTFSV